MIRARTRTRSGGLKWFNSTSLKADGISPTLALDFQNNRYASSGASRPLNNIFPFVRSSQATYVGSDGLLKTAGINELRYAYDPETLVFKGAMMEASSSNSLLYSEDLTNGAWLFTDGTITPNYSSAPDGANTSFLATEGTAGTAILRQLLTVSSGSTNTFSVFLKYNNCAWVRILIYDPAFPSDQVRVWVNLQTMTLGTYSHGGAASGSFARLYKHQNGWVRVSITGAIGTATSILSGITSASTNGSTTRVNNAAYQVWGAQFENKSLMTSYIKTTSSTVSRTNDLLSAPTTRYMSRTSTGTYRDYDGILQTASIDEVRYNYSSPFPSKSSSIMIEPSTTNTAWVNTYTSVGSTATKNDNTGPDGIALSADTFTSNTLSAPHYSYGSSTAATIGQPYVISQFVKYVSGPVYAQLATSSSIGTAQIYANFDITTGTVAGTGTDVTGAGVEVYAGGWYRIWMSFIAAGAGVGAAVIIGSVDSPSTSRLGTAAGNGIFYLYGSQFESGSTPSSYIPTTTSAVTRSADTIENKSSNILRVTHQFTNAVWQKVLCSATDGQTDPYGTSLASLITDSAGNSYIAQISQVSAANKTVTFSIWIKTDTKTGSIRLRIRDSISFVSVGDLYVSPTTSWARYSVTGTFDNTYTGNIEVIADPVDTTVGTYYVFAPQLEYSTTTSPELIVNNSTSTITDIGAPNWLNYGSGTMLASMEYHSGNGSSFPMFFRIDDTTTNNRINIFYSMPANTVGSDGRITSSQFSYSTSKSSSYIDSIDYAQSYRKDNAIAYDKGSALGSVDTSCNIPTLWVAKICDAPADSICYIKRMIYYPNRISPAELQRITTP